MRLARYSIAAAALVAVTATPAFAQVDVRVKVDTKVIRETAQDVVREIREAMQTTFGPELRRDIHEVVRDIVESFEDWGNQPWGSGDRGQSRRFPHTLTDRETRRFNVGSTGQLDLENISGNITIRRGSGRDLVIEILRESRGTTEATAKAGLDAVRAVSEERGGRVTVKTSYPMQRGRGEYSVDVNYVITAPAGARISTQTISGDVVANGIDGELSVTSISGDLRITDVDHLVSASTTSGDVTLTNVRAEGMLEASTTSGEIMATGLKARRVSLQATSGGVTARGIEASDVKLGSITDDVVFDGVLTPRGRYEFMSHSGDVLITVDGRVGFTFEGSTFSGNVRSDLPLQGGRTESRTGTARRPRDNRNLSGTFGDGSAQINATSFSGAVVVTKK
jgi:hypothetical protein